MCRALQLCHNQKDVIIKNEMDLCTENLRPIRLLF